MNIDTTAPLHGRQEALVAAPPEHVWRVLTDIEHWPEWQTDISFARLDSSLAVGTTFRWKAKGMGITSTIRQLEPGRHIGWTGDSLGMHAIHLWTLEPHVQGTRVITAESLSGWLAQVLRLVDRAFLEKSLTGSLRALKRRAEEQ